VWAFQPGLDLRELVCNLNHHDVYSCTSSVCVHGQVVLLSELQWAVQQGIVASIIKTFASRPAVGLSAGRGRVQHSRHLLCNLPVQWAFRPGMVTCLILGVLKEPFVASPCSLPSSLRGIIASPCCSPSVMFGVGVRGAMLLL